MSTRQIVVRSSTVAALVLLCMSSLMAAKKTKPILVRIDDTPDAPPTITVKGAPNGYDVYTGPEVVNPDVEDGALITLFGVDQAGTINPSGDGWRFTDPSLPADTFRNATDIVWIDHDFFLFGNGDLQIGFNSRNDGGYYVNPIYTSDASAGDATNQWVTVYSDATIEVQYKARTP